MRPLPLVVIFLGACGPSVTPSDRDAGPHVDPVVDGGPGPDAFTRPDATPLDPCRVADPDDRGDALPVCDDVAPPNSFEPEIQWTWTGPAPDLYSIVAPLVGNLTDDNGDGQINLCDVPDVLVVASFSSGAPASAGHIYLLDGQTGTQELMVPTLVDATVTPAIGDIDHDGLMEIVTCDPTGHFVAFEHDGTLKWTSLGTWPDVYSGAIALADLDGDGEVEIIGGNIVLGSNGVEKWRAPVAAGSWSATAAADLDGDGKLEVVLGNAAYHWDGTQYYYTPTVGAGYPQIANLDADPEPEVLIDNFSGITVLEHDGTVKYQDLRPTGDGTGFTTWLRPSTIHDFDGDGAAEFAVSSANHYTVYEADGTIKWSALVSDQSGIAAGTAFDFLGDGTAEAMYADEFNMFIFDGTGTPLLSIPRSSGTLSEYPVVADIDNDGSAEIVVVSNAYQGTPSPTVQVIRDREDRWIQARRIWNEHTYHVTNVREDGTIPQHEAPSYRRLNTFRTNAQIGVGGVCEPIVQ